MTIDVKDLEQAHSYLKNHILQTQCTLSRLLSRKLNANVRLKLENLQLTGSYKVRGALNKIKTLHDAGNLKGVIASSAGNHAQGVAYAASKLGIEATIVMPQNTPLAKVVGTKNLGAEVVLHGSTYDEAYEHALKLQQENDLAFVHPFNDPEVIAGQGSIAFEILDQFPDVDVVIVPVGGGGLISGISSVFKIVKPSVKIYGVEAEAMPAMKTSLEKGKIVRIPKNKTIAEGIAVRKVMENTFEIVKKNVEKIVTVNDAQIARAMMKLLEVEKVLTEGAGACSFAAALENKIEDLEGKNICLIVSGGNVDLNFIAKIIERGLAHDGRLAKFEVIVPDVPGTLSHVTKIVGQHEANILEITHSRNFTDTGYGETVLNLVLECKGRAHINELFETLMKKYKVRLV